MDEAIQASLWQYYLDKTSIKNTYNKNFDVQCESEKNPP